jgi:hypothetical protein
MTDNALSVSFIAPTSCQMKTLSFTKLHLPKLITLAKKISPIGYLQTTPEDLIYLDIDDEYIHSLFPLLQNYLIRKPNYFESNMIGAHISAIYPEEKIRLRPEDLNLEYEFQIQNVYTATLLHKQYFVLIVEAPGLVALRQKYGLIDQPIFKDHFIQLHITIGVL